MRGKAKDFMASFQLRASEPRHDGFNDGVIIPPEDYPLGSSPSRIRGAAAEPETEPADTPTVYDAPTEGRFDSVSRPTGP